MTLLEVVDRHPVLTAIVCYLALCFVGGFVEQAFARFRGRRCRHPDCPRRR